MDSKCKYQILTNYKLVIGYYSGKISEHEIISLKETIKKDKAFNIEFNTLDDFTETDFNTTKESFHHVFQWLKNNYSWERKSAVLTHTPEQVANILRFDYLNRDQLPMSIKVFSTLTGALQWIGLTQKDEPEIRTIIEKIKG